MIMNRTRAERGLQPYVSPKKKWDETLARSIEMLTSVPVSTRRQRRIRQADSRSTSKKSRRATARKAFDQRQFEANLVGIARVYLRGAGSGDMRHNVTEHVYGIARARAAETGQSYDQSLKEVEGRLMMALPA